MHIMIDIETLGTRPGSVVASIGAVVFSPAKRGVLLDEFEETIDIANAQSLGLTIDADTVTWWMKQEAGARLTTFGGNTPLAIALLKLTTFIDITRQRAGGETLRVWAHSPAFDLVLLEAAYRACGLIEPWTRREPRDTRTLFDLAGVDPRNFAKDEIAHNALADAKAQARAVIEAYRILNLHDAYLNPRVKEHG